MTETNIKIVIELTETDIHVADIMLKKMLRACSSEEIELINNAKISKTVAEIESTSEAFDKN